MALINYAGFEFANNSYETGTLTGTAPGYDSTVKRSPGAALKWTISAGTGGKYRYSATITAGAMNYLKFDFLVQVRPATYNVKIACWGSTGGNDTLILYLKPDGSIFLYNNVGSVTLYTTAVLPLNEWNQIVLGMKIVGGSNDDTGQLYINGTQLYSSTTLNLGTAQNYWEINCQPQTADTVTILMDNVFVNDDQGATSLNGFPKDIVIGVIPAISDNARGANWVAGAGGTTNLWDAVDNMPPVGVNNAGATNTSQIKNTASDTTGNYDANVKTYLNYGIDANDVIVFARVLINKGCSTSLSCLAATQLVSNPADPGETSYESSSGGAVGTWPAQWGFIRGTNVIDPSITLDVSPVARVGKRAATTRITWADWLGVEVGYYTKQPGMTMLGCGV